jgi:hypothetical protein
MGINFSKIVFNVMGYVVLNQISNNKDLLLSIFFHPATENKTRIGFFPFNSARAFAKITVVIEHSWVITF